MSYYTRVKEFIESNKLVEKQEGVIQGISGGADSVCLLSMLDRYTRTINNLPDDVINNYLIGVHIHHGIRGEEADRDCKFVEEMCKKFNVRCLVYKYDVPAYAKKNRISEEEAGRNLRYETFRDVLEKYRTKGFVKISVAHNLNDNAETVLHNICRGTGLRGLSGIKCINGDIIRPILCLKREEIEDYLENEKISYIIDSSNLSDEYTRNKLRLKVLPYLQDNINRKSIEHISYAAENISKAEEYLEKETNKIFNDITWKRESSIYIDKEEIRKIDKYMATRILRKAIFNISGKLKDITNTHIEDAYRLINKEVSKYIELPYSIIVKVDYDYIIMSSKKNNYEPDSEFLEECHSEQKQNITECADIFKDGSYELKYTKGNFIVSILDVERDNIDIKFLENTIKNQENIYTKWFDYDRIRFIVQLRYREAGDYLTIGRELKHKKLKAYFIDCKIPKDKRDRIPLVTDGNHVMWVVGYRISEEYKVTDKTKRIIKIEKKG